jgi:hypothetical protein
MTDFDVREAMNPAALINPQNQNASNQGFKQFALPE